MEQRSDTVLSPAEFLADGEEAVTDRMHDPLAVSPRPDADPVQARDVRRAVSASVFARLAREASPLLVDARVNAVYGSIGRPRGSDATAWITLTSRWGYARLVRNGDGSGDLSAVHSPEGTTVVDLHHGHVEANDLDELIRAIARPAPRTEVRGR